MAEENKVEEENPFDALAAIIKPSSSYEDAYKRVWTAMKSGTFPEEKVIKILLSACAMPALCAANIKMEQILRAHGLIVDTPQGETREAPEADQATPSEPADAPNNILRFPSKEPVVN